MTRSISTHQRIQMVALTLATLLGLFLSTSVGAGIVVRNPADTINSVRTPLLSWDVIGPIVPPQNDPPFTIDPIVPPPNDDPRFMPARTFRPQADPDSVSTTLLATSANPPGAVQAAAEAASTQPVVGRALAGSQPFMYALASPPQNDVEPNPSNPREEPFCAWGQIPFDNECIGFRNVQSFFKFNSDDTTLLSYEACREEDDTKIDGCIILNVDLGVIGFEQVRYMLLDTPCERFGGYPLRKLCFKGYRVHHRAVHEIESEVDGSESYLIHTVTHQVLRFRLRAGFYWSDELVTSQIMEYDGDWSYASGLNAELSWSASNGDENTLFEDLLLITTIADGDDEVAVENACAAVEMVWANDGEMMGDFYASSCNDMVEAPDSVEGEIPLALFTIRNDTDSTFGLCNQMGRSLESAAADAGAEAYQACLANPEDFFPNQFGEDEWDYPDEF